jgi:hypothetical protein
MKVKELIRKLQEADPTGEIEVVVPSEDGWVDIYHLEVVEGYHDGPYQLLVHDPKLKDKSYSIVGAEYRNDGEKLVLHSYSIKDALLSNPDLPVKVIADECPGQGERMTEAVNEWRKEMCRIRRDVDGPKPQRIVSKE